MASRSTDLIPIYVLHRRPYRETSYLVDLLSETEGRLTVIARGMRSRRKGGQDRLPLFAPLLASWAGRGELPTLRLAEPDGAQRYFRGARLLAALYVNELIVRLTHRHDPAHEVFHLYGEFLRGLDSDQNLESLLRIFERDLLLALGYGLILDHEVAGGAPVESAAEYVYAMDRGPLPCRDGAAGVAVSGRTLLGLMQGQLEDAEVLEQAKRLMRAIYAHLLQGRPLQSRKMFYHSGD